jgi:hypothetical protein
VPESTLWATRLTLALQEIGRNIEHPGLQSSLPPRNTLLYPLAMPRIYGSDSLDVLLAGVLGDVQGLDVLNLPLPAADAPSARRHSTPVPPPPPFAGFLVAARANTWSRAARRKAQAGMATDDRPAPVLVCRVYRADASCTLGVDWVRGKDRAMFESFASHVVRKVRTAVA